MNSLNLFYFIKITFKLIMNLNINTKAIKYIKNIVMKENRMSSNAQKENERNFFLRFQRQINSAQNFEYFKCYEE